MAQEKDEKLAKKAGKRKQNNAKSKKTNNTLTKSDVDSNTTTARPLYIDPQLLEGPQHLQ